MVKFKILVVEDDRINLNIIVETIPENYDVKVASNGMDGLKVYKSFNPDIIISDIDMPIMNGIEMLKEIRVEDKNLKAIVLTAHDKVDYLLKATELNLTKYLIKPLLKDELLNTIKQATIELKSYTTISKKFINLPNNYMWDYDNLELYKEDELLKLTPKEKKILNYMLESSKNVKSYDEILYEAWEDFENPNKKILKTMMTNLRKKLPSNLIENVYGIGYKINLF